MSSPSLPLIVSIDTEEDNWIATRESITTHNIQRLLPLQRRFDALGIRATYFTNYQVCINPASAAVMQEINAGGHAEIGAHLHAWNTPPLLPQMETMLLNVPPRVQGEKLERLTQALQSSLGVTPTAFRAGRFGLGAETVACLIAQKYKIDSSVTPFISWERFDHGPTYVGAPLRMYRLSGHGDVRIPQPGSLIEVPLSSGYNRWHPQSWPRLQSALSSPVGRRMGIRSTFARLGLARPVILSPEVHGIRDLEGLATSLLAGGVQYLHVFWHSPSMTPGLSPFCATENDVDQLMRRFEQLLERLSKKWSLRSLTISEAARAVMKDGPAPVTTATAIPLAAARPASTAFVPAPIHLRESDVDGSPFAGQEEVPLVPSTTAEVNPASASTAGSRNQMGRHTAIYLLGILIGRAVSFVMLPFYTRYLTPADYGIMQLLDMTLDVISIIAGTRIASGIHRYYFKASTPEERKGVLSTAFTLMACSFVVFGLVTAAMARPLTQLILGSTKYTDLILISSVTFGLQALVIVPNSILQLEKRSALITTITTARLIVQLGLNIVFLSVVHTGLKGVFLSGLAASVFSGLWMTYLVLPEIGLRFSPRAARNLVTYGLPLVATQFATFFVTYGDRYFLRVAGDLTEVGLYSLAYQFGFLVASIGYYPFSLIWEPTRFQVAERPDRDHVFARAFVFMNLILCVATVGTALFVRDFIMVMSDAAYHGAYQIVPIILIAYVLQSWAYFHEAGILIREKTGYITLANWVSGLTALAGYALLVPRFLGWGAAIATVIAFAVRELITFAAAQLLLPIRYEWAPVWRLVGASTAFILVGSVLPHPSIELSVALRSVLFVGFCVTVWHLGVIPPDDKAALRRAIRSPVALATYLSRG